MAKAPDSKIPVGGFHVFNIPSPYGSMLLILETSSPICSSLVPKPEDRGRDKAQRKSKNEKRERDGEGGWGQVKTNTTAPPLSLNLRCALTGAKTLPVRLGFSPWERSRPAHIWLPQLSKAPCRPPCPLAGGLDSSAQGPSGGPTS